MVDGKLVLTDSTHVKANASLKANVKVLAEQETTDYMERLDRYEAEERQRETAGMIIHQHHPKLFENVIYFTALTVDQCYIMYKYDTERHDIT